MIEQVQILFSNRIVVLSLLLVSGAIMAQFIARRSKKIMELIGIPEAVEGTSLERTMGRLGTSTVIMVSKASMWVIIGSTIIFSITVLDMGYGQITNKIVGIAPSVLVSVIVLASGIVLSDKTDMWISRNMKGVKISEIKILPKIARYSIVYISILVALGQLNIATDALIVLLGVYAFALVAFSLIAFGDMLKSSAAGFYFVLVHPYGIGDEIRVGKRQGVVQEITLLVTIIDFQNEEHIIPNSLIFREGVSKMNRDH